MKPPLFCRLLLAASALLFVPLAGCSQSEREAAAKGTATGLVTLDGQPVSNAMVNFTSGTGTGASASVDSSGEFHIDEPFETGEYVVTVVPDLNQAPGEDGMAEPDMSGFMNIPDSYRDDRSSNLTATVAEGENSFVFNMDPNMSAGPGGGGMAP